jgi:hypothetical protein
MTFARMQKRDSLLHLLVKWNLHEQFPALAERLATEDILIPNLRRTIEFLERLQAFERGKAATPVPVFTYKGLTADEGSVAFSLCAVGAHVGDARSEPQMAGWIEDMCRDGQVRRPRLIILESDEPFAGALCLPGQKPVIFVTSNLREILNERQLRAVLGHELRHVKERANKGKLSRLLKQGEDWLTANESALREEFRAYAFSTKLGNAPDDMVDALLAMRDRLAELRRFGNQAADIVGQCLEPGIASDFRLAGLLKDAGNSMRILEERDWETRKRNNRDDEHPPMMSRFTRLFDCDGDSPSRG